MASGAADDGGLDAELLEGFRAAQQAGDVLSCNPSGIEFRRLDGRLGLVATWHEQHWTKKRPDGVAGAEDIAVVIEPDAEALRQKFNFTKVRACERVAEFSGDPVLVNVSPLAFGHLLLPPSCNELLPQVLTRPALRAALQLCGHSGRRDLRMIFNSRGAFASVNHLHFHILYLRYCGLSDQLPIEVLTREPRGRVEIIRGYPVPALALAADEEATWRAVAACQTRGIPHNVVLSAAGVVVVPRRQQRHHDVPAAGFNAAVMELCGMVVARSRAVFEGLTEGEFEELLRSGVALPEEEFEELVKELA